MCPAAPVLRSPVVERVDESAEQFDAEQASGCQGRDEGLDDMPSLVRMTLSRTTTTTTVAEVSTERLASSSDLSRSPDGAGY